jgi:two-component system, cell cycle response regulator
MENKKQDRNDMFRRAWDIIVQDKSIASEEKEGILKLIQVLVETTESSPARQEKDEPVKGMTQDIVSRHSLLTLVKQQADELDALKRISLNLTSSLDLQTVLETVVTEAMKLIRNSHAAHIYLYSHGELEFGAALSSEGDSNKPISEPRSNGLTYMVARNGMPIIIDNMIEHPLYKGTPAEWSGSIIGVPLKFYSSIVGVMNISKSTIGGFNRSEMRLIGLLADQAAVAISNASLHKGVTELANTDSVTGLPNRRALDERLQDEMRYARNMNSKFSVVMMDLDGFKNVNDTLGHSMGDDVLHHVFNYLAEKMRATDFLARYGGDELTLIMRDSDVEVAEIVANKIVDLMKSYSFPIPGSKPIQLGITAGIAVYPLHSHNASDLLRAADAALYWAKKHNRGKFVFAKVSTGPLDPLTIHSAKKG